MNVIDSLSFHGFNLENHQGCPLYFLKLRFKRPRNPLEAGTAIESEDGTIRAEPLTMPTIATIIEDTFAHHTQQENTTYVALQLVQINQLRTDTDQNQTYFSLIFRQHPDIVDAIDPFLILNQLREIVWTDWLHFTAVEINQNRANNVTTKRPASITKPTDRTLILNPTNTPWTPFMDFYIPACNAASDRAYGILAGLPVTVPPLSTNRRLHVHLTECLFDILQPHLPTVLNDFTTFPNLIGIRRGSFSSPQHQPSTVAYISASNQQIFNLFYQAHLRYLQVTQKPCINLYGFQVRINPMPDRSRQGLEIRGRIHATTNSLRDNLKPAKKVPIPVEYFTEDVTDTLIERILNTRLVIALIPDFDDESNDRISHYVLFVIHNYQTYDLGIKNLEYILPDFPKNIITIPANVISPNKTSTATTPSTPPIVTNHQSDMEAFDYMLKSPAFATAATVSSPSPPPMVTTKRRHLPTGETVKPAKQKSKSQAMLITLPQESSLASVNTSVTGPSDATTSTQDGDLSFPTFTEHQPEDIMMDEDEDSTEGEEIPDSQYKFSTDHSQPTRLEIMDALGIARAISEQRYNETYNYIANHGNSPVDIDQLKCIATRPKTPPPRAHNDFSAHKQRNK
jgi:hypothetical protein